MISTDFQKKKPEEIYLATLEDQRERLVSLFNAILAGAATGDDDNVGVRIRELDKKIAKEKGNA
jgi:hypothetical protein